MIENLNISIRFFTGMPPFVQAVLIILIAAFVALLLLPLAAGVVKFLTRKTKTDVDDKLISTLNKPIFNSILLIGVIVALPLFMLPMAYLSISIAIVKTLLIIIFSKATLQVVNVLLNAAARSNKFGSVNDQTRPLFYNLTLMLVILGALYAGFLVWGIDVTAWLASAGILGIAIGFAAKDTLANLISGAFILADKPYSVGDLVVLGSGITGIVSNVGLRSTRIRTFDDEEVTIPNGSIANEALTNKSTGPDTGRVKVAVGVAYGSDVSHVEKLLLDIALGKESVLDDPAPSVSFINFGESSLDFVLSCRVKDPLDVFRTASDLRYAIYATFEQNNIEIPFPQTDVHMKN